MKLKPYTLVRVRVGSPLDMYPHRSFIGEVMSLPTPEGTVMIREIPGHPETIKEFPVDQVSQLHGKFRWVQYAVVDGGKRSSFPEDMLRYDVCVPVNFKLEDYGNGMKTVRDNEGEPLLVATVTERQAPNWTVGRWNSFGWSCKAFRTERMGEQK